MMVLTLRYISGGGNDHITVILQLFLRDQMLDLDPSGYEEATLV